MTNFLCKCECGATAWIGGSHDESVNATDLRDDTQPEWENGQEGCAHKATEIIDYEDEELDV